MAHGELGIEDLRSFAACARSGSITRAAQSLGLSQPAVTKRIQRLEQATGAPLLFRDSRGTRVTPLGEVVLTYAERLLTLHDEALAAVVARRSSQRRTISMGVLEDLAATALPHVLGRFAERWPDIDLRIVTGAASRLRRLAREHRVDVVVGDTSVMEPSEVTWRRRVRLRWSWGPGFDPSVDPLSVVLFSQPCEWRQPTLDALNSGGREWRVSFENPDLVAVQGAVLADLGLTAFLAGNVPRASRRFGAAGSLPPAPRVDVGISRHGGTRGDSAIDDLEGLLKAAVARRSVA